MGGDNRKVPFFILIKFFRKKEMKKLFQKIVYNFIIKFLLILLAINLVKSEEDIGGNIDSAKEKDLSGFKNEKISQVSENFVQQVNATFKKVNEEENLQKKIKLLRDELKNIYNLIDKIYFKNDKKFEKYEKEDKEEFEKFKEIVKKEQNKVKNEFNKCEIIQVVEELFFYFRKDEINESKKLGRNKALNTKFLGNELKNIEKIYPNIIIKLFKNDKEFGMFKKMVEEKQNYLRTDLSDLKFDEVGLNEDIRDKELENNDFENKEEIKKLKENIEEKKNLTKKKIKFQIKLKKLNSTLEKLEKNKFKIILKLKRLCSNINDEKDEILEELNINNPAEMYKIVIDYLKKIGFENADETEMTLSEEKMKEEIGEFLVELEDEEKKSTLKKTMTHMVEKISNVNIPRFHKQVIPFVKIEEQEKHVKG